VADAWLQVRPERSHHPGRIEMIHMMHKQQAQDVCNPQPLLAEQFNLLAA
jgi:hypothetical protein